MKKYRISLPSSEGKVTLHGYHWIPDREPAAVLVLSHGMIEHIERYDEFAVAMTQAGIAVVGVNHLGHGDSLNESKELGFFAERHGDKALIRDLHLVTLTAAKLHPGKPVFMLGHSMGSFLLRLYMTRYGSGLAGAIVCGTGNISLGAARFGVWLTDLLCRFKGKHYRSRLVQLLAEGQYSLPYLLHLKKGTWLSGNDASNMEYMKDPRCGFCFTVGAYRDFFRILKDLAQEKDMGKIPLDLPVLFISGMEDPLGAKSKGVLEVYNSMVARGFKDLDIYLYAGDKHEILHELDRDKVFSDVQNWIMNHLPQEEKA